jgi:hypothetical protein
LVKVDTFSQHLSNCVLNQDPLFVDEDENDYRIDTTASPASNAGTTLPFPAATPAGPASDALGQPRVGASPDIGAYVIPN